MRDGYSTSQADRLELGEHLGSQQGAMTAANRSLVCGFLFAALDARMGPVAIAQIVANRERHER